MNATTKKRFGRRSPSSRQHRGPRLALQVLAAAVLAAGLFAASDHAAHAGGGPENVLVIVDPTSQEGLQVANYYRQARGIPDRNIVYVKPGARNYEAFSQFQLPAVLGTAANRQIGDHIDYLVVAPGSPFYVDAPNLINGNACSAPVRRLAISAAYGLSSSTDGILGQAFSSTSRNQYHTTDDMPYAFSASSKWLNGSPSGSSSAAGYHLGFMLGYTGQRGNTVDELIEMIDRSVAADGSNPQGTFYYMETEDVRSGPRVPHFSRAIASLQRLGASAEHIEAVLPDGRHDVLGLMTGLASPKIDDTDMTLIPGTYADHLTSFAGRFDTSSQVKMSRWIPKGASGTAGTVEEPCAMRGNPGKFPHPHMFVWYYQGLSLGEALFRSIPWMPFQTLLYGDPLTRPFASFPEVAVVGMPGRQATGTLVLLQSVEPGDGGEITALDLFVDGVHYARIAPDAAFVLETQNLPDGMHDLSVVAYEDRIVQTQGAWRGELQVANRGHEVTLSVEPPSGDLDTAFTAHVEASGEEVVELRLMQGGRLLGAATVGGDEVEVKGEKLGAGQPRLYAVAEFASGRIAISRPITLTVAPTGGTPVSTPGDALPTVFDHHVDVLPGQPLLVDLPAFDGDGDVVTRTVAADLAYADLVCDGPSWLLKPAEDARGEESFTYRATDGRNQSASATVTVRYCTPPEIVAQPQDLQVCPGETATFDVQADGGVLDYRWYRNEHPIPGAVGPQLTIERADYDDNDEFHVVVTEVCGLLSQATESQVVSLEVVNAERCRKRIYLPFAEAN